MSDQEAAAGAMRIYGADTASLLASQRRDPLLRHLTRTIVHAALRYSPPAAGPVIDVGCGIGRTTRALARAGYRATGVDPSERAVALAAQLAGAAAPGTGWSPNAAGGTADTVPRFHVADATGAAPPQWAAAFSLAVCSEVLEHVTDPAAVVRFCRTVLRPGGVLILSTPHDPDQWTVMDDYAGHVTRFRAPQLRGMLNGFRVVEMSTEGFPFQRLVMWTYDWRLRRGGGEHAFEDFGHTPLYRAYAAVMPLLLRIDHLFRRSLRGTTLVAVARKTDE